MLAFAGALAGGLFAQTPVAYYPFSGSAKDESSFGNNGAVNGANLAQDRFGWANNAFDFDGVQGGITAGNADQLNSDYATISFWIKPSSFPAQGEVYLLSNGGWQERWKISLPSHGKPVFTTHSNGACCSDMDSGTPLTVGTWTHVAMVHDGSKDIIYFNGVKVNEKNVSGALDPTVHPLGIGYDPIDKNFFFDGAMDEVMIFDVALGAADISALYAAQSTPPAVASGPVSIYSFDGNGLDGTGYGNHADLSTGELSTDRFGYGKSALLCNGTSSEVSASNSQQMNSPYTTVAFWVKPNSLPGNGESFLLSFGGWQERWKISLPSHGKPVWTTNHSNGISDMDSGDGNSLPVNKWTHVAMVHDGAKDLIYMNGVKVAEKNVAGTLNSTSKPLGIGYNPIDGGNFFDGALDEILIFNYALSEADIAAAYAQQSTFPGTAIPLVASYPLNGNGNDDTQRRNHAELKDAIPVANRHGWGSNAIQGSALADNSPALQSDYTTIAFWVNPSSFPGSGEVFLLSNGGWQERWKISLPSHGKPVFTTHSGGACCSDMDSGTPLALNTWTHVTMVHDGSKDIIYFNGVKVNEKNVSGALDDTKYPLGIGFDPIDNGGFFDGALDDILIFDQALDAAQIAALYAVQSQAPVIPGELVANYPFGGNSLDATDYNNHAAGASYGKDRFGKTNKAAAIGGTASITAANSPQLNTPYTTIAFWAKPNSLPGSGEVYLLSHGGWQERWKISLPSHGKPVFTTHSNGACCSDMDSGNGNVLVPGTWTHVAMVHDGTQDKIYMNGVKVAEKNVTGALDNTAYPFGIGYNPIDGGNNFDGDMDEVRIYNTALTDAQIAALYDEQSQPGATTDDEAPLAPLNLSAEVSFNNVGLNWLPATDNVAVTAYNIYIDGDLAAVTAGTSAYFPALTPLTLFTFGVSAVDAEGNESLPTTLKVTTGPEETPDIEAPSVPGNLSGDPSFNSVLLSWDASTDNTIVNGYIIWVDGVHYDSVSGSTQTILITGLEPQTLYSFEVAAFDLAGNLSDKAELTISTTEPLDTGEPGLVAHYPFEGNGNDATPYQNHGVVSGNPVFEAATHPQASGQNIKFDGNQDSVLAPNAVQLLSDYTTVSFWVRVDGTNIQDAEAYVMDFGHWDQRWKVSLPQHRKIVWTTNSNNTQFPNFISDMDSGDGNELVPGVWSYITMVHDGTNDLIYKDGVLVNTKPAPGKLNATARPLCFGNNPIEGGQYFIGALDEVKIYNRAITADEAANLYNNGSTGTDEVQLVQQYVDDLYPNPATTVLNVRHSLPSNQSLLVRVFDLQGRQLDAVRLSKSDVATGQFTLQVGNYPKGMYALNFVLGGKNLGSVKFEKH